ncbi:hypothetical protein BGW39_010763 [Mortierella sp. 14UC]|nr:hypothetical protein BGW39_010763 [Mortierella sp. 14UC]
MVLHQTLFSINADWNDIPMPHLQELSITTTEIGGTSPGAGLIVQCPNLRILRWSAPASLEPGCFKEIVKACPRLEVIELQRMALPDDVIAMILDSMKASVTEVIITGEEHVASGTDLGFSIEAFRSLERRHFSTLVVLDVGPENFRVDSASLLQVLYSCPNLRQLRACRIWAEDINDGHQQQQQQQQRRRGNWACRGLEVFEVKISVSLGPLVSSIHEAVFCQFAALPRLRVLHIGGRARYKLKRHQLCIKEGGGLSLRLEHGMGHVAGLARLESVSVGRFAQELRREDVNWMKRYWVGLRALQGELHPRREVSEAIRKALTDPREDMKTMLDRLGFS